jgi:hypothetical protein
MLRIESNLLPPIDVALSGEQGGGFMALLQPRIVGELPIVGTVEYAPHGAPLPGVGTAVFAALVVLAAVGAFTLIKGRR